LKFRDENGRFKLWPAGDRVRPHGQEEDRPMRDLKTRRSVLALLIVAGGLGPALRSPAAAQFVGPPNANPKTRKGAVGPCNTNPKTRKGYIGPCNTNPKTRKGSVGPCNANPKTRKGYIGPCNANPKTGK
jgi:hypothetical protein